MHKKQSNNLSDLIIFDFKREKEGIYPLIQTKNEGDKENAKVVLL